MKPTEKQKKFADYYIELGDATKAARKAGYSKNLTNTNATKLLQNTTIKNCMTQRLKQLEDERIAPASEVLMYLTSVMRAESESEVVVVEGSGDGCSAARCILKHPDEKERLRAAELLGRRYGVFSDKLNIEGSVNVTIVDDVNE